MNYRVAVQGRTGKMGREVCSLLSTSYRIDEDTFELSQEGSGSADVWIDFSRPAGTLDLLKKVTAPVVVGTTGFTSDEILQMQELSKRIGILVAPNLSPGMNYIYKILRESRLTRDSHFSVVASETHHVHKKDSPSGTLKRVLKILEEQGREDVPVQVTRVGEILGQHQLRFVSDSEEIVISHEVRDRSVFAKGALLGAHRLLKRNEPGLYALEDLI